jgi:hypothetical protein
MNNMEDNLKRITISEVEKIISKSLILLEPMGDKLANSIDFAATNTHSQSLYEKVQTAIDILNDAFQEAVEARKEFGV